jgi:hypothetical protein
MVVAPPNHTPLNKHFRKKNSVNSLVIPTLLIIDLLVFKTN